MMNNKFVDVVRPGLLSNTFGEDSIIWVKLQQLFFFLSRSIIRLCGTAKATFFVEKS